MPYPLVSHTFVKTENTATSSAINTIGASLIFFGLSMWDGASVPTPSDSAGNTWTTGRGTVDPDADSKVYTWYCYNPTTNASHTFTLTGSNFDGGFTILAFQGVTSGTSNGGSQNGVALGNTSVQPGSFTPSNNNSVIVSQVCAGYNITGWGVSGLTLGDNWLGGTNGWYSGAVGWLQQGSAAAINPTWSWTTGSPASVMISAWPATAQQLPIVQPFIMARKWVNGWRKRAGLFLPVRKSRVPWLDPVYMRLKCP